MARGQQRWEARWAETLQPGSSPLPPEELAQLHGARPPLGSQMLPGWDSHRQLCGPSTPGRWTTRGGGGGGGGGELCLPGDQLTAHAVCVMAAAQVLSCIWVNRSQVGWLGELTILNATSQQACGFISDLFFQKICIYF